MVKQFTPNEQKVLDLLDGLLVKDGKVDTELFQSIFDIFKETLIDENFAHIEPEDEYMYRYASTKAKVFAYLPTDRPKRDGVWWRLYNDLPAAIARYVHFDDVVDQLTDNGIAVPRDAAVGRAKRLLSQKVVEELVDNDTTRHLKMMDKMVGSITKHTMEGWVLEHGMSFIVGPDSFPGGGKKKECYSNALHLATERPDLIYCEGYAFGRVFPVMHAWCCTKKGEVVDPTWDDGKDYFGVPFDRKFVWKTVTDRGYYGVIDDWQNGWPLVRLKIAREKFMHKDFRNPPK